MFLASLHQNFLWMFTACKAKAGADLGLVGWRAGGATGEGWQGPEDLKREGSGSTLQCLKGTSSERFALINLQD